MFALNKPISNSPLNNIKQEKRTFEALESWTDACEHLY